MIPTRKHLEYALGYLELGLLAEARREIAAIPVTEKKSPAVLTVRLELAMSDEKWPEVLRLAPHLVVADGSSERPWIAWAYALREHQRITEARDVLLRGAGVINAPSVLVDYNLACYFCLLGDLTEARRRLDQVFAREPAWKTDAAQDPDLAALRKKASKKTGPHPSA